MTTFLHRLWRNKGISLAAAWSFNQLAYAIVYPFIPIYLCKERGMDYSLVSLIFPLLGLAVILAPVPCGWLTDRFGHNSMMLWGQLLRGVIFFGLAGLVHWQAPFWAFAAALMFNTAVGVAFQVGSDAYLVSISSPEERPGYYGKIRIGFNFGWALGPMLGAFFAQTPFWVFFIITGMLCVIGTFYTRATCCGTSAAGKTEKSVLQISNRELLKQILHNHRFLLLMAGTLFLMMLASQLYSTLSVFSTGKLGINKKALGSIYSMNGFMVLILQLPVTSLLTRIKLPVIWQLLLGCLLYTAGYAQMGFAGGALAVAAAVAVVTLGEIVVQPALYTSVSRETTPENAGRMMSVSSLMRGIGYAAGPWFGGILFVHCHAATLWLSLSCFALAAGLCFAVARK